MILPPYIFIFIVFVDFETILSVVLVPVLVPMQMANAEKRRRPRREQPLQEKQENAKPRPRVIHIKMRKTLLVRVFYPICLACEIK